MICPNKRACQFALAVIFILIAVAPPLLSCDLCTINNADLARRDAAGFQVSLSELYVPYRTPQLNSEEVDVRDEDYLYTSITHVVPTYNFGQKFGISLNAPIVHRDFKRDFVVVGANRRLRIVTEEDNETGLGDLSLIGRWTALQRSKGKWSGFLNVLAGVKFPTGDAGPLRDEAEQVRRYNVLVGPGHVHDALGVPVSGVHARDVSLGSGSFDGVFGTSANVTYDRFFFNNQLQYYLRTEGESTYEYGDEFIVSGGPGAFLVSNYQWKLSLQANAMYETMSRDKLFGKKSNHTGMTGWYLGPLFNLTVGKRFNANLGIDAPLSIANNGFQNVPDWRLHGGIGWRF